MTVNTLGPQLIALLGLPKHCLSFELRCAAGELVTVKCEFYPEEAEGFDLVLAEYELVSRETPASVEPHPAEVTGFDAWMRERNEAAHQAMMKHAQLGGVSYEAKKSALRLAIPGTQVVLNSGGPVMTVIGMTYDGKAVACAWHVDGLAMGDSFPMECLLRCDVSQAE